LFHDGPPKWGVIAPAIGVPNYREVPAPVGRHHSSKG
jgi:hypothetical protein